MQQTTMAFITINLQLTSAVMTNLIVSIDFFFGLILNEDCKWILLDEADVLLVLVQYSRSFTKNATF